MFYKEEFISQLARQNRNKLLMFFKLKKIFVLWKCPHVNLFLLFLINNKWGSSTDDVLWLMYIWIDVIDEHLFVLVTGVWKWVLEWIRSGNQHFKFPTRKLFHERWCSSKRAPSLTCSLVFLQDGINILMGTTVMMGTPSAPRAQDSPTAPRSQLEMWLVAVSTWSTTPASTQKMATV